jgi:hypothetical protein
MLMARTVSQAFQEFKPKLEISNLQEKTVSTRQNSVREVVGAEMEVIDSFLSGSYARSTLIAPLAEADIDVFVVLSSKYFHHYNGQNGGQAGLLDLLKRTLLKTYTRTPDISRNGQAVTIRFEDFAVDVVPAFSRQGGGYLIPNSIRKEWLSTDPKAHTKIFSDANAAHNGDLVPMIKMIKCWNRSINRHFRSFHLEVLAHSIYNKVTISNYWSGMRFFLDKGRALIAAKNPDPAGYGDDVGNYIVGQAQISEAVAKLQTDFERALKAEQFADAGDHANALDMWKKVFGEPFPAYG